MLIRPVYNYIGHQNAHNRNLFFARTPAIEIHCGQKTAHRFSLKCSLSLTKFERQTARAERAGSQGPRMHPVSKTHFFK